MSTKSIVRATCACLIFVSFTVSADLISIDWKIVGDNLITRDTVSGLDWLDLTETNNMSYGQVSEQIGTGGQFAGYRYATNSEVVALWANFGVNLDAGTPTYVSSYVDPGIEIAAVLLGNIVNEDSDTYPFGVIGLTANSPYLGAHLRLGAYNNSRSSFYDNGGFAQSDAIALGHTGSYLVKKKPCSSPCSHLAIWFRSCRLNRFSQAKESITIKHDSFGSCLCL